MLTFPAAVGIPGGQPTMAYCLALDFSRFKILTFDCYGTLIDWETGILSAVRPILSAHNAHLSDADILRIYAEIEAEEEAGAYQPYKEILQAVVRGFGTRLGLRLQKQNSARFPACSATGSRSPIQSRHCATCRVGLRSE